MATKKETFILTEAAEMLPLVRRILRDIRQARSQISRCRRRPASVGTGAIHTVVDERRRWQDRLDLCLAEAAQLGIEITPGVRCEALFPFHHQWVGEEGDQKIRPAYFVYSDAEPTIRSWFFSGWPHDRRAVNARWWHQFRRTPTARLRPAKQEV